MRSIASLEIGQAAEILDRLKEENILVEVITVTDENGLEMTELMVEDEFYDRACDVAEKWQTELTVEARKRSKKRCPECHSFNWESIPNEKLGHAYRCKDCGCEFFFRNE